MPQGLDLPNQHDASQMWKNPMLVDGSVINKHFPHVKETENKRFNSMSVDVCCCQLKFPDALFELKLCTSFP